MRPTKAIIALAGYGTRWLPLSKAIEKYMVPIGNRPLIDWVVKDLVNAGIQDIYFVVNKKHDQLRNYYSNYDELSEYLKGKGREELLELINTKPSHVNFHYVIQEVSADHYGTAIPVWLNKQNINEGENFIYVTGDDFIYNPDGSSEFAKAIEMLGKSNFNSLAMGVDVGIENIGIYGSFGAKKDNSRLLDVIVEKPEPGEEPSTIANISKFILNYDIFLYLERVIKSVPNNKQKEFYFVDALTDYAKENDVLIYEIEGKYVDGGNPEGWLKANNLIMKNN